MAATGFRCRRLVSRWAAFALAGLSFAAVAAVAAQVTQGAGAARGLGIAVLGGAYLLRAVGDAGGRRSTSPLSWLSPIGWAQQLRPYADERWWVLPLSRLVVVAARRGGVRR